MESVDSLKVTRLDELSVVVTTCCDVPCDVVSASVDGEVAGAVVNGPSYVSINFFESTYFNVGFRISEKDQKN